MRRKKHRELLLRLVQIYSDTRDMIPDEMITEKVEIGTLYVIFRDRLREVLIDVENR